MADPDDDFSAPTERVKLQRPGEPAERTGPPLPATVGRFLVRGLLGSSNEGLILEATDPGLQRTVAVKLLSADRARDPALLRRFQVETRILAQLSHPAIPALHEAGSLQDGRPFYVMERVAGTRLAKLLAAQRSGEAVASHFTHRRLLRAFVQLCQAVAHAHERGVLHRDLKPGHVVLGQLGELQLLGWGVARVMGTSPEPAPEGKDPSVEVASRVRTVDGATLGTPGFMSPEQARGELATLDGRSDVFALGAILFELLALQPAFVGATPMALLLAASRTAAEDPRSRAPQREIPEPLARLCLHALELDRDRRCPAAGALAAGVEEFLDGAVAGQP